MYWEAMAEYADGTTVDLLFDYNDRIGEGEQEHNIECWLVERHPDITWWSVNIVCE